MLRAQDTIVKTQAVKAVSITNIYLPKIPLTSIQLSREKIDLIQPEDVGQLLQYIPGLQMKSYGGLGGFKTLSARSIGGTHTALLVDGFSVFNTQTGQVNLGLIQTDNIENISFNIGQSSSALHPVSAQISGSALSIESFEATFPEKDFSLKSAIKQGSFEQYDSYLALKKRFRKSFVSVFGKYRVAQGEYPYRLQNGYFDYSGNRNNNDFQDAYAGLVFGVKLTERSTFRLISRYSESNQGLPGAVILYNNGAGQRLNTHGIHLDSDYNLLHKTFQLRVFAKFSLDDLQYTDSTYMNTAGFLQNDYRNQLVQGGISLNKSFGFSRVYGGLETRYAELKSDQISVGSPLRQHYFAMGGYKFSYKKMKTDFQLSAQFLTDRSEQTELAQHQSLNPFASLAIDNLANGKIHLLFWFRNSFRMPTFNELYYNSIGNKALKPEKANQISSSVAYNPFKSKSLLEIRSNIYFNRLENQILAIPTKNLFIWSMQNIGRTNTFGADLILTNSFRMRENWSVQQNLNTTYQYTVDISSTNSPTYRNQIAYIPKWSGSYQFTVMYKNSGLRFSAYANSKRYALNENIETNEIEGFVTFDAGIFSRFKWKENSLRAQFTVKNFTNESYSFVRYFVMPGVNYLISLTYELH